MKTFFSLCCFLLSLSTMASTACISHKLEELDNVQKINNRIKSKSLGLSNKCHVNWESSINTREFVCDDEEACNQLKQEPCVTTDNGDTVIKVLDMIEGQESSENNSGLTVENVPMSGFVNTKGKFVTEIFIQDEAICSSAQGL